jgi:hypothetical protein
MNSNSIHEQCDNHPSIAAVACCTVCGKPVCGDCAVTKDDNYYCDDVTHRTVLERFVPFGESKNIFEIELIAKNLSANGITTLWFHRQHYRRFELPVLYVPFDAVEKAYDILHSLDLLDFIEREYNV